MNPHTLRLPERSTKPRHAGLTMVIDNGMPTGMFEDSISSAADYIDMVKFGWGTALVTADLGRKVNLLKAAGIPFSFGGTLFEKFVAQDRFDDYLALCRDWGAAVVEVSNGTIPLSNAGKASYISKCCDEFEVVSEVGFKDVERSQRLSPSQWVSCIAEDLGAGATRVIMEARESGRSGICRADGELRWGLIEDILVSGVDPDLLVFEAPTKQLQTHFVTRVGPNVNLGNVAPQEVIGLETLRLGLRADTLVHFESLLAGPAEGEGGDAAGA
ncbi:MAG: phosphosulfolactate synthase [Acidimicrobiales bacterium]